MKTDTILLGIESSCDDTAASIVKNGVVLSNIIANQKVHKFFGGVVPELAARAHQQNIIPVVDTAIKKAGIQKEDLSAIAFTCGPGLLGSLLVGTSFAKGLSIALNIPIIEVNHLQAHVLVHFIKQNEIDNHKPPQFPFLCLLVSGGNSQIILVKSINEMRVIGQTIDDAAGEAFDKCAKLMGFSYPGGPIIDSLAKEGNPDTFQLSKPSLPGYNYSFSGLKTSFLYLLRNQLKKNPFFVEENKADLSASLQTTIIDILMNKLYKASIDLDIKEVALAGGVSANSGLRKAFEEFAKKHNWKIHIPSIAFTTDNAAMVAISGYFKYLDKAFCQIEIVPFAKKTI
ncbi:MAG: tRNA (adenosine(37)-N6)-threonylcarbamoyltransferase complex transferase subunit TsaD [Candidatus Azobacteroides pseudotrichonymphae]|jgi:N6-L-threonylcarbamoyladenine synthase|uniref:tRNA N6-adenosine threonylcarbamoyltransferase n=1 Tax=Azobacteroides pseudotrichonymphae genomovar. CFP2 TaxID=511995 RepID=B6YS25_AZOPC|nr:tRNA (adenosine(37)-N6)-threonylcarbamoyltransferase complex transferase subunit TsaD [Candidatus Azobacteroides pseudotrichonymphae]MDR0530425.1 tRNA (adenosine(37)-N6)-threonylcarbamoyltransferase complex transferase subunit TsaD [Bacteroidales bacterium OttesenSCG-928-I14]BAG83997.1 O-sialoglycoprotein endopeptidase [Candidatus Azobacteroides pseudotrichonymphae genomovar. CFP2]GMO33753.1 MAG: tRNA (adenosine(37)-N6)-threonylcarbamoyltransferase complex transferase subunit TsaD [Candidatus